MIQNINTKSILSNLDKTKLPSYWNEYFQYEKDVHLSSLTRNFLIEEIEKEKTKEKPYIDSQVLISNLLTSFGANHSFHRQFREKFPLFYSGKILGMQLYHIIVHDNDIWTYINTRKTDHLFPHATYFK